MLYRKWVQTFDTNKISIQPFDQKKSLRVHSTYNSAGYVIFFKNWNFRQRSWSVEAHIDFVQPKP